MAQFYPMRSVVQESTDYAIRLLGTGAANPTKQLGQGVVVTRGATAGLLNIKFAESPFQFLGGLWSFQASTPGDAAGWSLVFDDFDTTTLTLPAQIYKADNTIADLLATQRLFMVLKFARTGY